MAFRHWFWYFTTFGLLTIVMQIGESSATLLTATDLNQALGFNVEQIASGSNFISFVFNVTNFLIQFIPKVVSFNYSFLQGDLEVIRWMLMLGFGVTFIGMLALSMLGALRGTA